MANDERARDVLRWLEGRRDEMIGFACELVATPSINPPGDERAVADLVLAQMEKLGLEGAEILAKTPQRPNLVYRQPGRHGRPTLIFNAHMDTKPVGAQDRTLWRTDPLAPTIIDGKLYGLGATDMKGAIAALVYAAAALRPWADALAGDLMLILVADEEAAGEFGARWLVKHQRVQADFCLVAEPCGIDKEFENLPICDREIVLFKVKVHGTQLHSSLSDRLPSVNASVKMAWVLWRMAQDLEFAHRPHPFYPQGPTINLGDFVQAGVYYGVYPGYAEFGSDIRLLPGMTQAAVQQELRLFLAGLRQEDPELNAELEFVEVEEMPDWAPLRGDEPFIEILLTAVEHVLGRRPALSGFPATTDAYWFHRYAGIPSLPAFGPGLLSLAHGPNEHATTDGILQASQIYALAALTYLG